MLLHGALSSLLGDLQLQLQGSAPLKDLKVNLKGHDLNDLNDFTPPEGDFSRVLRVEIPKPQEHLSS